MNAPSAEVTERGHTTIAPRVVKKIAARAATTVEQAGGTSRQLLGISFARTGGTGPAQVDVMLDGDLVSVQVTLSVQWPAPVREVSREVREQVEDRIRALTGLTVAEVDIDVVALPGRSRPEPGRVS